jgi:hypothetical protein
MSKKKQQNLSQFVSKKWAKYGANVNVHIY